MLTNTFGSALIATKRSRWLIGEGVVALVFNVVGNLVLVPTYGVLASAWLTVATEVLVLLSMVVGLRGRVHFGPVLRVSVAPVLASVASVGLWWATRSAAILSFALVGLSFALVLGLFGGWPEELPVSWPRRLIVPGLGPRSAPSE